MATVNELVESVEIDYTNWHGDRRVRRIMPMRFDFTSTEWHPETQWICWAQDHEDGAVKAFALGGVHSWKPMGRGRDAE